MLEPAVFNLNEWGRTASAGLEEKAEDNERRRWELQAFISLISDYLAPLSLFFITIVDGVQRSPSSLYLIIPYRHPKASALTARFASNQDSRILLDTKGLTTRFTTGV